MTSNKSAEAVQKQKTCFVIGPIGNDGSDERRIADWLLKGIIKPVLTSSPLNYLVQRADEFPQPGQITDQVINATESSDLVIADLTGQNANAFYELAIRHMAEKPVIHMVRDGDAIPFDVTIYRAVKYDIENIDNVESAKTKLREQVLATEATGYKPSNPITSARGHKELQKSSDPKDVVIASLISNQEKTNQALTSVLDRLSDLEASEGNPVQKGWAQLIQETRARNAVDQANQNKIVIQKNATDAWADYLAKKVKPYRDSDKD